jgi:SAM-dependent methyltransferase
MIYETKYRDKCVLCGSKFFDESDIEDAINKLHDMYTKTGDELNHIYTKTGNRYIKIFKDEEKTFEIHNNIGFCRYCGLVQTINPMTEKSLEDFYRKPEVGDSEYRKLYKFDERGALVHLEQAVGFLCQCIDSDVSNEQKFDFKEILDLGSGGDYSLKYLNFAFKNSNSYVYDPGMKSKNEGVLNDIKDRKFDVIFVLNVLEHVYNPVKFLENLKDNLTDNGHIILSVPDIYNILLPVNAWFSGAHLWHFGFDTFQKTVIRAGYERRHAMQTLDHIGGKLYISIKKTEDTSNLNYQFENIENLKNYLYHHCEADNNKMKFF